MKIKLEDNKVLLACNLREYAIDITESNEDMILQLFSTTIDETSCFWLKTEFTRLLISLIIARYANNEPKEDVILTIDMATEIK